METAEKAVQNLKKVLLFCSFWYGWALLVKIKMLLYDIKHKVAENKTLLFLLQSLFFQFIYFLKNLSSTRLR